MGLELPKLEDIYINHLWKKAESIMSVTSHTLYLIFCHQVNDADQ